MTKNAEAVLLSEEEKANLTEKGTLPGTEKKRKITSDRLKEDTTRTKKQIDENKERIKNGQAPATNNKKTPAAIAQQENNVGKKITLRAVYGKTQGVYKLRPAMDSNGRLYTGQGVLTEEDKRHISHVVDHKTTIPLTDGYVVDLNDEVMAINWEWMKHHPVIAESFDEAQSKPEAMFYVEDIEKDMDKRANRRDMVFEAMGLLKNSNEAKKREVMRLVGQDGQYYNLRQIEDFLMSKAETHPQDLIAIYNDVDYKPRLLLYVLIDKKKVEKTDGIYAYGGRTIATTESQAIEWLKAPENNDIVKNLMRLI